LNGALTALQTNIEIANILAGLHFRISWLAWIVR
jgi:hypothetical protein